MGVFATHRPDAPCGAELNEISNLALARKSMSLAQIRRFEATQELIANICDRIADDSP